MDGHWLHRGEKRAFIPCVSVSDKQADPQREQLGCFYQAAPDTQRDSWRGCVMQACINACVQIFGGFRGIQSVAAAADGAAGTLRLGCDF